MSTVTTGSFAKSLWPGVNSWYGREYGKHPELWRKMFDVQTSTKAYEEDVGISGLGLVPAKGEGEAVSYDTEMQGFVTRYVNTTYGLGFIVTKEAFEDDQYNVVGARKARNLAFSVATTINSLGAAIYNNSTSYTGGDGVSLLNDSHPNAAGGTWDNLSASTFSESALESACIAIRKWTNDRGLRINANPEALHLPPDLEFDAERILQSPLRQGTANNDINALKNMGSFPGGYMVNPFILGTTSWYIKTNVPDGMKAFVRREPQFTTDNDFDTENAKFKTTFRMSFGWTDPRGLYGYDT